ncbi:hypothetical protein KCP78_12645 [Salmonella enterica subsp. enterica]|nr:hypothetical protein KCP78_12645 [Salmonella enterica subsp. enterica]
MAKRRLFSPLTRWITCRKADLLPHLQFWQQMNFHDIMPISAETGMNVDTAIASIVRKHLPEAIHHFRKKIISRSLSALYGV